MKGKTSNSTLYAWGCVLALFLLVSGLPLSLKAASEGPIIRSGETVGVEADQILSGDFYGLGNKVTISGQAREDVYALGETVTVNASIEKDLVIIGRLAQVHGRVNDDVRILGAEVIIAEPVAGDVVVVGGSIHILSTASVGGDLIFFGSEVVVDGAVEGTVYGTAETVRINAKVGEEVRVRTIEPLVLGDSAAIAGNLTYKSEAELVRAQESVVSGTVTREPILLEDAGGAIDLLLFPLLILIFSSFTVFFLARSKIVSLVEKIHFEYGLMGLIGLGALIFVPLASIILMASVIGLFVGIALLCAYVLLGLITMMCLPIILGIFVQRLVRLGDTMTLYTVILGVCTMFLLPFIPFIGGLLLLLAGIVTFGALSHAVYLFFRSL